MSEVKSDNISNLHLSSEIIILSQSSQSGEIIITNNHHEKSICFKIKTKIQKIFDVKPTKGLIKPGDKAAVSFKAIKMIEDGEKNNLEKNMQFLLQAVNRASPEITKEQEDKLWKQIKQKTADTSAGYCYVKLTIDFSGDTKKSKEYIPSFSNFDSKIDNRFSSEVKSVKKSSMGEALNFRLSNQQQLISTSKTEAEMSDKYQELKNKQQQLIKQRQKILMTPFSSGTKSKGGKSTIISNFIAMLVIVVFVLAFLLGNYLSSTLNPKVQQIPEEKGFFSF